MPPAPKSPQTKRPGAPKAKGAVRAKSGCYTCRIRRKKCDEQMNSDGACQTCVRLRLQCLGFGAKRPDWLRESRNVLDLREKIKTFLASQGMIKGHSGSGPRTAEQEPQILHLSHEYASPSTSPQTPTLSISSSDERLSSTYPLRGHFEHPDRKPTPRGGDPFGAQPAAADLPAMQDCPDSPGYPHEVLLPAPYPATPVLNNSLDWHSRNQSASVHPSRPHTSDFSPLYSWSLLGHDEDDPLCDVGSGYLMAPNPHFCHWNFDLLCSRQNAALKYYMENVVRVQYLHADVGTLNSIVWAMIHSSEAAREAACLLSDLHRSKCSCPPTPGGGLLAVAPADTAALQRLQTVLPLTQPLTEGDALAGLCVVSYFLFSGGKGQWQTFLDAVCRFSVALLNGARGGGPRRALRGCSPSVRFIIKTSVWFDVLASATLVRTPIMLGAIRALFSPHTAEEGGLDDDDDDDDGGAPSMMSIMGCENHIVYGLAEIAALAAWKEGRQRAGTLSVLELVQRGRRIKRVLEKPSSGTASASASASAREDEARVRQRRLTSEVFRASAHVYLHSVISGDHPQCPEIIEAVDDTVRCLRAAEGKTGRPVVRSVVFSICISGCLTNDAEHQRYFLERLAEQRHDADALGNCPQVENLIKEVWGRRRGEQPVDWRRIMREAEMLLV